MGCMEHKFLISSILLSLLFYNPILTSDHFKKLLGSEPFAMTDSTDQKAPNLKYYQHIEGENVGVAIIHSYRGHQCVIFRSQTDAQILQTKIHDGIWPRVISWYTIQHSKSRL
jgi:hypothetical protein